MREQNHIKQDLNFLDKQLWFQNVRPTGIGFQWEDESGYIYRSGYKPPDKVDIIILLYLLKQSQECGYARTVTATRCQILKGCELPFTNRNYYKRLEDSLRRWKNVAIEFQGNFYDGGKYLTKHFGIIDNAGIREEDKRVEVEFNENWLLKIKESGYFKYINFYQYRALKRPVSRRLFEILCKTFAGRNTWKIGLVKLGKKIPLTGKEKNNGRVLYASRVLEKIKPALREINSLVNAADTKKLELADKDRFTVTYKIVGENQNRIIIFTRHPVNAEKPAQQKDNAELQQLLELLQRKPKTVVAAVRKYYYEKGFDYTYRSIRYANVNAKKNYSAYVKKALKEDWAAEYQEGKKQTAVEMWQEYTALPQEQQQKLLDECRQSRFAQALEFAKSSEEIEQVMLPFLTERTQGKFK